MRIALISDLHLPEHNKQAFILTKKIIGDLNIELLYLLGDIFNFDSLSRFLIKPDKLLKLQEDIDLGIKELQSLRAFYSGRIKFYGGNHDFSRLQKFLYTDGKRLNSLRSLKLPNLLQLKDLDIQYHDREKQPWDKIGKLYFMHGDENKLSMPNAAKKLFERIHENVIVGHHHKFDSYYQRTLGGGLYQSHVNACLQNRDPEWAGFAQWDLGFSVIDMTPSGYFKVEQIRMFENGKKMMATTSIVPGQTLYTT